MSQEGDAAEEHREQPHHPGQRRPGIPPFGGLEGRHPVSNRLHARHCRGAGGEGLQDQEDPELFDWRDRRYREGGPTAVARVDEADPDQAKDPGHEQVGGEREKAARLAQAPQVAPGDGADAPHRQRHLGVIELGKRGGDCSCPCGHRNCDGENVVAHQAGGRG